MAQAETMNGTQRRAEELADELNGLDSVLSSSVAVDRLPPRVNVHCDGAEIPDAVRDRISGDYAEDNQLRAEIRDATIIGDDVGLELAVKTAKESGVRKLRANGSSLVVTLTAETLETSGFNEDDRIQQHVRDGEVTLTNYEG